MATDNEPPQADLHADATPTADPEHNPPPGGETALDQVRAHSPRVAT